MKTLIKTPVDVIELVNDELPSASQAKWTAPSGDGRRSERRLVLFERPVKLAAALWRWAPPAERALARCSP